MSGVTALGSRLNEIGFERTRRAIAALALSLFISLYLAVAMNAPNGLGGVFAGLAFCYAVAFCSVVAEWFWGRWFATGLGWSGIMLGAVALLQLGWTPIFVIYLGLHALIVVSLMASRVATTISYGIFASALKFALVSSALFGSLLISLSFTVSDL